MTGSSQPPLLGQAQTVVLGVIAVARAVGLTVVRGGLQSGSPLDQLARRSLEPDVALANGRPTMIEFYADWCQVCREMAPAMLQLEQSQRGQLDVVMVNVDNPRWQDLVDRYDVNGIPQLNLFDAAGQPVGRSIGLRREQELQLTGPHGPMKRELVKSASNACWPVKEVITDRWSMPRSCSTSAGSPIR